MYPFEMTSQSNPAIASFAGAFGIYCFSNISFGDHEPAAPQHVPASSIAPRSHVTPSDPDTDSPSTMAAPNPDHEQEDDSGSDAPSRSGPDRRKRTRASQKNPIYGLVNGARRGNKIFSESDIFHFISIRPSLNLPQRLSAGNPCGPPPTTSPRPVLASCGV